MLMKGMKAVVLAVCVFGAMATSTQATAAGVQKSLLDILIASALVPAPGPGTRPPPK